MPRGSGSHERVRPRTWITSGVVLLLVVALGYGYYAYFMDPRVEGTVVWHEDLPTAQLGPAGWVLTTDEGDAILVNVLTDEQHSLPSAAGVRHIRPDGGHLTAGLGQLAIHDSSGEVVAEVSTAQLGAGVPGLSGLLPGRDLSVLGVSEETAAVVTCYAPSEADVDSEAAGGHLVLAGVRLADGSQAWARDTGVGCTGYDAFDRLEPRLGTVEHVAIHDGSSSSAIRIDDGSVRATWDGVTRSWVAFRGDLALHISGDTAIITDLARQREVTSTRCADMRGTRSGHLAATAALSVRCGPDQVRIHDASTGEFGTVDHGTVGDERLIPDGERVVHGQYVLHRSGQTVTITEALSGEETGSFTAPQEAMVSLSDPFGRLLTLSTTTEELFGDSLESEHVVIDLHTGDEILAGSAHMSPGIQVDPAGVALVSTGYTEGQDFRGRSTQEVGPLEGAWVVTVRDTD